MDVYLLHTQKEATPRNPAEIIMIISCQTLGQEFQVTNTHARASQQQLHSFLFLFLPSRNISISILLKWATSFFAEELRPIAQKNRAPNSNRRKNQICVGGGKWRANESLTHHPPPSYIPSDWKENLIWSWSKSNQDLVSVFFFSFFLIFGCYIFRERRKEMHHFRSFDMGATVFRVFFPFFSSLCCVRMYWRWAVSCCCTKHPAGAESDL